MAKAGATRSGLTVCSNASTNASRTQVRTRHVSRAAARRLSSRVRSPVAHLAVVARALARLGVQGLAVHCSHGGSNTEREQSSGGSIASRAAARRLTSRVRSPVADRRPRRWPRRTPPSRAPCRTCSACTQATRRQWALGTAMAWDLGHAVSGHWALPCTGMAWDLGTVCAVEPHVKASTLPAAKTGRTPAARIAFTAGCSHLYHGAHATVSNVHGCRGVCVHCVSPGLPRHRRVAAKRA
jgi:hypothetical protein